MKPETLVITSGATLILVGLALVVLQFWLSMKSPGFHPPSRSLDLGAGDARAAVQTTYVGLALVVVGAFLEVVGLLASRMGKKSE